MHWGLLSKFCSLFIKIKHKETCEVHGKCWVLYKLPLTMKSFLFLEKAIAPTAPICPDAIAKQDPVSTFQILTCMNRQSTYIDQELEWGLCNHFEDIFHLKWSRSISRSTVIYSRIQENRLVLPLSKRKMLNSHVKGIKKNHFKH